MVELLSIPGIMLQATHSHIASCIVGLKQRRLAGECREQNDRVEVCLPDFNPTGYFPFKYTKLLFKYWAF